ncbi:MAG TPA: efflux RND transporter periplasmic adaptor subunit [Runella sp.]|nr:efflux RND transporter periplasmic adaptor subunit [Runella sp.]
MTTQFFGLTQALKITLISVTLTQLLGCSDTRQEVSQQTPPISVDFGVIHPTSAQIEKKYPGLMEGTVNVALKAQVTGYLDQIYIKEGGYVRKGQSLFRIKGDVYQAQVNTSQASLDAAIAAEQRAKVEMDKVRPLVEGKVVSVVQLHTAEANYTAAKAEVDRARASLGSAQINAGFSLIKAPVSGYIGRIPNRIGNLVTPADITPLTTLSDIEKVLVYFSLSEAEFIHFMKDRQTDKGLNTVELILADGTRYSHKGHLELASGNIDPNTGSIPLKAVFPNPDKLLRSGGSAKIILTKSLTATLTVPMASVKDIQDRFFVFTLADSNKVSMTPIQIGGQSGSDYIVTGGLIDGQKVALNRIDVLREGESVAPKTIGLASN